MKQIGEYRKIETVPPVFLLCLYAHLVEASPASYFPLYGSSTYPLV
jgi:hypothetical protein